MQTRYTPKSGSTEITTSFYDPEEEFVEIGISKDGVTFWKLYGPTSCDAVIDEFGHSVFLYPNALGLLSDDVPIYGREKYIPYNWDLSKYAYSLEWHSKSLDPTGLIWMGARYYNPKTGKFLSKDPIGYPTQTDLYSYAVEDPINFIDPDGRFASSVYETTKPLIFETPAFRIYRHISPALFTTCRFIHGVNQQIIFSNNLVAYFGEKGCFNSCYYEVGSFDLLKGEIGFTNGVGNTREDSIASALLVSKYAGGAKVTGTYNRTNTLPFDVMECLMSRIGIHTAPVQVLKNNWRRFLATHGPDAKYLQICHSGGAIHVKNALMTAPKWIRERIIVVAIAPGEIIPSCICSRAYNFISRDFVPKLDPIGMATCANDIHLLDPHPDAKGWDHEFASPTYEPVLRHHIQNYIQNYGGK